MEGQRATRSTRWGGRKGVEHEANKASKWEDDGVLRQYPRMRSRLWGYPNGPKWGKNDDF